MTSNFQFPDCKKLLADDAVYLPRGPKPAPNCINPNGGTEKQAGCFCPDVSYPFYVRYTSTILGYSI